MKWRGVFLVYFSFGYGMGMRVRIPRVRLEFCKVSEWFGVCGV